MAGVRIDDGLSYAIGADASVFEKENKKVQAAMQSTTRVAQQQSTEMEKLASRTAAALGAFAALNFGANFVKDVARVRGEMQQLETAFSVMLGSKAEADRLLSQVAKFAATTPFELSDVAGATKQLLAFGIGADKIEKTLRSLGDVAAGVGKPLGELAYLYGTINTAGKANAVDLKQFATAGIPIYTELAKVLKVGQERIEEMVSAGKIGFPEIEKAFQSMAGEGSKFGGMMEKQSQTIVGLQSSLQDAVNEMLNNFGKSSEGVIADTIRGAISIVENYEKVIDILKAVAFTYGTYRAALLLSTAATNGLTIAENLRAKAILLSTRAMTILNATLLKNPFAITAALVGALAAKFIFLNDTLDESKIRTEEYSSELKKEKDALEGLFEKVQKAAEGTIERKNAIVEINKQYGSYLPKLLSELSTNQDLAKAYENLNDRIEENIALKFKSKRVDSLQKQYGDTNDELFDTIFSQIRNNVGNKAAGAANVEFNNLVDQLEQLEDIRNKVREGLQKGNIAEIATKQFKLIQDFARKYKLLDFESIGKFAKNRFELKQGIKDVNEFYDALISHTKKTNDDAQKTLEDYLKENNFINVLDQALNLATTKGSLELIKKKLEDDKNSLDTRTQQAEIDKYLAKIESVNKLIDNYDPKKERSRGEVKENTLLSKRKQLLEDISELKRASERTTMSVEQSAIDQINEKYESLTTKVIEYNNAVDAFNKKNPSNALQKINQVSIAELNASRELEINAEKDQKLTEDFKKNLDAQKEIYQQYEDAKREMGELSAKDLYISQTAEFNSYLDFLEAEASKINEKIDKGLASPGDKNRFKFLKEAIEEENKKRLAADKSYLQTAIKQTISFEEQKLLITKHYNKLIEALENSKGKDGNAERIKMLEKQRDNELQGLKDYADRQTAVYKLMTQDIIGFTEEKIVENIKTVRKAIKDGFYKDSTGNIINLTPAMRKELEDAADQAAALAAKLTKAWGEAEKLEHQANELNALSSSLSGLANIFQSVNEEFAGIISQTGAMIGALGSATSAMANFKKAAIMKDANPAESAQFRLQGMQDMASAALSVIQQLTDAIQVSRESTRIANQEVLDFQTRIIAGEVELSRIYREREREQARLNKTRADGLRDELDLLKQQKKANEEAFNDLLKKIQQEQYIESVGTKKSGAGSSVAGAIGMIFGLGRKTKVDEHLASLANKSFEELEKLFVSGQLSKKAEEYFKQLQELKEEGLDVDRMMLDMGREWQEMLTGTTTDSLTDSLMQAFANGERGAADFADNFEDLMRGAMLNSIKFKVMEPLVKDFLNQMQSFAESGAGIDAEEKQQLADAWDKMVEIGTQRAEELEKITGISLTKTDSAANSLQGSIRAELTEETGSLIAGQFGGLRITAIDQLRVSSRSLDVLIRIQSNTAELIQIRKDIADLQTRGIKIRT